MGKIICMLRVKDGILFIDRWLENIGSLVDEIVVVDNGSNDGTLEKLKAHPKVTDIKETVGFHEGRDRIMLLEMARERKADWLIGLDVDEIFEESFKREHIEKMTKNDKMIVYGFRRFHLLYDENHYQAKWIDILELSRPSRHFYKVHDGLFVRDVKIHCAVENLKGRRVMSPFRILHLCNLQIEYRKKAYDNYIQIDPQRANMYKGHKGTLDKKNYKTYSVESFKSLRYKLWFLILNLIFIVPFIFRYIKRKIK